MRRILSLTLMVMVVLRGLMGTAMAAGVMPTQPVQAVEGSALHMQANMVESPAGHGMHAGDGDGDGGGPQTADPAHCHDTSANGGSLHEHGSACADCDICHSAMLAPPAFPAHPGPLRDAVRSAHAVPFASVQMARTIKPPIA